MFALEFNYTVVKVLLAASFLGFTSGILGVFIILKKQALIGDALSHTALPGIALVYLFARSTDIWVLWLGAILASFVTLLLMELIKKYSKIKSDTVLSLVLASFFGLGNVLIAIAQNTGEDNKIATLEKFILGQIALVTELDMISTGIMALITLVVVVGLWKEFKIYIFDDKFAQSVGFNTKIMTFILNFLLIGVVVISLKIIGIILTSAFLIMPGVIARQFSDRFVTNVIVASIVTFFSSLIGVFISNSVQDMPTGPIIIVITTLFIALSLLFSPKYGVISRYVQKIKYQKKIKKFRQLIHLYYEQEETHTLSLPIIQIESFLWKEKYLMLQNQKAQLTPKGIKLVENLIDGIV